MTIRKNGLVIDELSSDLVHVLNATDSVMPVMLFIAPRNFAPTQPLYWANRLKEILLQGA
jgi:hypothetical protein